MIEIICEKCSQTTYINFLEPKQTDIIKIDFGEKSIEFVCPICNHLNIITQGIQNRDSSKTNFPTIRFGR